MSDTKTRKKNFAVLVYVHLKLNEKHINSAN